MKKSIIVILSTVIFTILSTSFFSCEDEGRKVDKEWKSNNIDAYVQITKNPNYTEVRGLADGYPRGIYKRVIKSGTGNVHPFQTAKVNVIYKGYFHDGTVFDIGNSKTEVSLSFMVNEVVRGFSTALQAMVVGDKWEVVIPYHLGYGPVDEIDSSSGALIMKAYTTLFFEVELLGIDQYPE
jgi:FKBP-type peptidyl-prolyl cis-trans isomerases 1